LLDAEIDGEESEDDADEFERAHTISLKHLTNWFCPHLWSLQIIVPRRYVVTLFSAKSMAQETRYGQEFGKLGT
jgi:hypothetical protein